VDTTYEAAPFPGWTTLRKYSEGLRGGRAGFNEAFPDEAAAHSAIQEGRRLQAGAPGPTAESLKNKNKAQAEIIKTQAEIIEDMVEVNKNQAEIIEDMAEVNKNQAEIIKTLQAERLAKL
jgi:hypothetical protein